MKTTGRVILESLADWPIPPRNYPNGYQPITRTRMLSGDALPDEAQSYIRTVPVRAQNLRSDIGVPLLQTLISVVFLLGCTWTAVFFWRNSYPVEYYAVSSAFGTAFAFWRHFSGLANSLTVQTESVDLAPPLQAQESEPLVELVELTVTHTCSACQQEQSLNTLELPTSLFRKLESVAVHLLTGNFKLSRTDLCRRAKLLTQSELAALQAAMSTAAPPYAIKQPNNSYQITSAGHQWLKSYLPQTDRPTLIN